MKFRVILKAFNNKHIQAACDQLKEMLIKKDCLIIGHVAFPTRIKKFCVIRSPHANKASREHFEIRIFKRLLDIQIMSPLAIKMLADLALPHGIIVSVEAI